MTDYRDVPHPGLHQPGSQQYRSPTDNGTNIGGILIALGIIALIFIGLSLFADVESTTSSTVAPIVDSSTTAPAVPAAPALPATQ